MKNLFRIRTVTAFLSLHPSDFPTPILSSSGTRSSAADNQAAAATGVASKISQAAQLLQRLEQELTDAGYEVQTLRIATNPFGEWMVPTTATAAVSVDDKSATTTKTTTTLSPDDLAVAKFRLLQLNQQLLRHEIGFCAVGPAASIAEIQHCCPMIVRETEGVSCSADIPKNDVATAKAAAACIKTISQLPGLNGLGNFRFCATAANNKAFIPFFPAAKSCSSSSSSGSGSGTLAAGDDDDGLVGFALGFENGKLAQDLLRKAGSIEQIPTVFRDGMAKALTPVQEICQHAATKHGYNYLGMDSSLNPSLEEGGSVAEAMEFLDELDYFGGPGTVGVAAAITTALQSLPGVDLTGYCGLMLPVCEDHRLAALAEQQQQQSSAITNDNSSGRQSSLRIADLLSVSSVCGVGIDTVPLAEGVSLKRLTSLILDMTGLAARWDKSLSCRVLPFEGKQVGDRTDFDSPFMVNADVFHL